MKQVKCPYCGNIQEATYDKRGNDWRMDAMEKFFGKFVAVCNCTKCGERFKEEENKTEDKEDEI